jgi:hypothetical protein
MAEKALIFYTQSTLLLLLLLFLDLFTVIVYPYNFPFPETIKELHVGYPLPKIDMIGVEYIDAIAMENWGI